MAAVRELLATFDAEQAQDGADGESPRALVEETSLSAVAAMSRPARRGVVLWRDDGMDWLARRARDRASAVDNNVWAAGRPVARQPPRRIDRFAVSLLLALSSRSG